MIASSIWAVQLSAPSKVSKQSMAQICLSPKLNSNTNMLILPISLKWLIIFRFLGLQFAPLSIYCDITNTKQYTLHLRSSKHFPLSGRRVIFLCSLTAAQTFVTPVSSAVVITDYSEDACCSRSLSGPEEAAWTRRLIFSRLQDAWWDVEADSWIDWPLLSAQALITTALKCPPPLDFSLPVLFSWSVSLLPASFSLPFLMISLSLQRERVDKERLLRREQKRAESLTRIWLCMVVILHRKVKLGEDGAAY